MSRATIRATFMAAILVITTVQASPLYADSNSKLGSKKVTSSPSTSTSKGTWIQPSSKKTPIIVQVGRSLPMKFSLIASTGPLLTTDMVSLSLSALSSCNAGATPQANSVTVLVVPKPYVSTSPSPSTTVSPSAFASPSGTTSQTEESAENEKGTLRAEKGSFTFNWKVPKNLTAGCYRLTAEKGDAVVTSPIVRVKSGR